MKPYNGGIRHDYKDSVGSSSVIRGRWSLFALGLSLPLLAVFLWLGSKADQPRPPASNQILIGPPQPVDLAAADVSPPPAGPVATESSERLEPIGAPLDLTVARGDTLEVLFRRNGLSMIDLAEIVDLPEVGSSLRLLKPGDHLAIVHDQGRVLSLSRELDERQTLSISRHDTGFAATMLARDIDIRITGTHGVIQTSLFEAGSAAGISDTVTMQMAGIFQWDIDFIQDVRVGDEFTVIYEELWRDGVKLRNGDIVATEFVNQDKSYRAARYKLSNGDFNYFTPEGRSVRKAFLRAPVEFTRISSNFNPNRRHPVLNTIRAHRGVDYAAPTGTPVQAAGDGKIIFRGVQGGYGNAIVVQHGGNITTLYGHLSRFGKARVGGRVRQGEVIGYVGKSGLATGPHLHYEYRVNGAHRNPRTVPLPPADPVSPDDHDNFRSTTATLWQQLDLYRRDPIVTAAN